MLALRIATLVGLVGLLTSVEGCATRAPTTPGMSEKLDGNIRDWLAKQWSCDEDQLAAKYVRDIPAGAGRPWSVYTYSGCNRTTRLFTACENADECTRWSESMEERAAFDLSCGIDELHMRILDEITIGVEGCGQKATYLSTFGGKWVMNNASERERPTARQ